MITIKQYHETVHFLQSRSKVVPHTAIILGTGLGGLVDDLQIEDSIPYADIPHFPLSTVESHAGRLLLGTLNGEPVVVMQGRFHYYEGYNMQQVTFPVRVMAGLGVTKLLISNAAGGINPQYALGDLMALNDHINLLPENPLVGPNAAEWGPRFPDLFGAYSEPLLLKARHIAQQQGFELHQGVYAAVSGPNLETPAEYRYLSVIGADAVGMSTVPEVLVARHMGLPVFAVSVITDLCFPPHLKPVNLAEIIATAHQAEPKLRALFRELVKA